MTPLGELTVLYKNLRLREKRGEKGGWAREGEKGRGRRGGKRRERKGR